MFGALKRMFNVPSTGPKTVLVVDDSATTRRVMAAALERLGFEVLGADSVKSARKMIQECGPIDLITLDWHMPGGSGLSLVKALKKHKDYRTIPVIMVSKEDSLDRMIEATDAGAVEYLCKPFDLQLLQEKLKNAGFPTTDRGAKAA